MGLSINTAKAHKVRQLGDITVIFTWVNDERAMVLIPTLRRGAPWFIVMDSAAYQYTDPRYTARMAIKAAEVLTMQGQEARIASLIVDHLDDLIRMPSAPLPELTRATYGQMTARQGGQIIGGEELRFNVGEGANYGA